MKYGDKIKVVSGSHYGYGLTGTIVNDFKGVIFLIALDDEFTDSYKRGRIQKYYKNKRIIKLFLTNMEKLND